MKKLLFSLFATILFASCSNEIENLESPTDKMYKVTFNVSNFSVDSKPLKSYPWHITTHNNYFYYTIYEKESGKALIYKAINKDFEKITEEIPAGNYYIAVVSSARTINSPGPGTPEKPLSEMEYWNDVDLNGLNFYSDYYQGVGWLLYSRDNLYAYYEKVSFSVGVDSNGGIEKDIALQPMWSVLDIEVTDAVTCTLPEGTNTIECTVNPFYYGFGIADGIPSENRDDTVIPEQSRTANSDVNFRTDTGIFGKVISASKDVTVKLVFLKRTASSTEILGERVIYKGDFDGGKHITLKGALGKTTSTGTFNVTLGNLSDGGIIPFE